MTLFVPDVLRGEPAMTGSARGTAAVMLLLGVPTLVVAMQLARRGSARAVFVWFGTVLYLVYNAVMLTFATPVNALFLANIATLGLSIAAGIALFESARRLPVQQWCSGSMPTRGLAAYVWVVVVLNALAWLGRIIPALLDGDAAVLVAGTGLTTVPTYVQDLAFWLPLLAVAGVWLRQRRPEGYLLVGGGLTMWVLEGLTVATDQWFGHQADPTSTVVSLSAVPAFAVITVIGAAVLAVFLKHVQPMDTPADSPPAQRDTRTTNAPQRNTP
ncbi:MAG: hypothetical protein WBG36_07620 [Ornithinimicrobium sp.]